MGQMKPIRIEQERLVFKAVLKKGVPTIPKKMMTCASKVAKIIGRKFKPELTGGNFEEVWFYFDEWITEEEEIQAEEYCETLDDNT